jgi:hypothetical protein
MTQAAQPNQIAGKTWPRRLLLVFLATLSISWIALLAKKGSSVDFYPLYFGARRIANGQSPYTSEANRELQNSWEAPFEEAGIVYPAPLPVLLVPLGILAYPVAARIWTTLGILLSLLSMFLVNDRLLRVVLLFLYMPLYSAASYAQASFIWFGLSALLVLAIDRKWGWWVGITAVVLALKPQDGLLFALYATWVGSLETEES